MLMREEHRAGQDIDDIDSAHLSIAGWLLMIGMD